MSQNCYGMWASKTGKARSKSGLRISQVSFVIYESLYMAWCGYDAEGNFIDFFSRKEVRDLKVNCQFNRIYQLSELVG